MSTFLKKRFALLAGRTDEAAVMIKPYYEEPGITIYCADCCDVLPQLDPVDLVLTDPPFFMPANHFQSRVKWQRSWGDVSVLGIFWSVILDAVKLKPTGHFLSFCNADSYPVFYPEMYRRFDKIKCLIWDKGRVGLGRIWRHQHELIIAARYRESFVDIKGKLYSDVIKINATPSALRDHPVEKPVELFIPLISPVTPIDGTILDPFMGSGTTLRAAKDLGRKAIGIEIEQKYCDIVIERLRQRVLL